MFERFTERARQVIVLAQDEARRLGHNYIGTEHVLAGLVAEEEGLGARVLSEFNLDTQTIRKHIIRIVGTEDRLVNGQIPFTPRAKKVFELALRESLSLGHNYIGTEHILLALTRDTEGVSARILSDEDINSKDVRNEVINMLSGPKNKVRVEREQVWEQHKTEEENSKDAGQRGWEHHNIVAPVTFTYGDLTLQIVDVTSGRVSIRIQRPSGSLLGIS